VISASRDAEIPSSLFLSFSIPSFFCFTYGL
jgi:hypothetical protein